MDGFNVICPIWEAKFGHVAWQGDAKITELLSMLYKKKNFLTSSSVIISIIDNLAVIER